jgi:hypothetical protein
MRDINITEQLQQVLPVESFLFNPSLVHIIGDIYLVSVRSVKTNLLEDIADDPHLRENSQHPWSTNWNSEHDLTYVIPIVIRNDFIQALSLPNWPLKIPGVQDTRLFRFIQQDQHIGIIVTFNQEYHNSPDLILKSGDSCDDWCYIINWGYLLVNYQHSQLDYAYIPSAKPLCPNISNPVEKNWSLWSYEQEPFRYLMLSYALTPVHTAFSFKMTGIKNGKIFGGSTCRLNTPRGLTTPNFFENLEKYYNKQLFVSLSTPAYPIDNNPDTYQAVGHLKVKIDYLQDLAKGRSRSKLASFSKRWIKEPGAEAYFHKIYVYFMFIYRFKIKAAENIQGPPESVSERIELTHTGVRLSTEITHISPAFVIWSDELDYFLNFPGGMVVNKNETIISYGNGDYSSHLLTIPNSRIQRMLRPVSSLTGKDYDFIKYLGQGGLIRKIN